MSGAASQHGANPASCGAGGARSPPLLPHFAPGRMRAGPRLGMVPTEGTVLRQLRLPTAGYKGGGRGGGGWTRSRGSQPPTSCGGGECGHGVGGGREKGPFAGWDTSPAPRCPLSTQPQVPATVVLDKSSLVPKLTRQGGPSPFLSLKGVRAAPKPLLAQSWGDPHHPDSVPSLATPRERSWDPGRQHPGALELWVWVLGAGWGPRACGAEADPNASSTSLQPACPSHNSTRAAMGKVFPQAFDSNLAAFLFFPGLEQTSSLFLWGRANSRSGTKRALTHKETAAAQ